MSTALSTKIVIIIISFFKYAIVLAVHQVKVVPDLSFSLSIELDHHFHWLWQIH